MKKILIPPAAIIILLIPVTYFYFTFMIHPVIPGEVYRSAQLSPENLDKNIQKYHIRSIINLRGIDEEEEWFQNEQQIAEKNKVQLYNVRLSAYKLPVCSELDKLVEILQAAEKPILMHCQAGADRSGMAGALVLAISQNASLAEMKKQFSWRYFVNPFRLNSSGKLFFSKYEKWLNENNVAHDRDNLLSWIRQDYVDGKGNIEFVIEYADKKRFASAGDEDKRIAVIGNPRGKIFITGWALDYRNHEPVKNLRLIIDNLSSDPVTFQFNRPDVAKYFNLKKRNFDNFHFGWSTSVDISDLNRGCYQILLKVGNGASTRLIENSGFELCIED